MPDTNSNAEVKVGGPTIAGGVPPNFRPAFVETSLRDAEWLRLPLPGARCPLTGLSRTTLLELGDRGDIVVKRIRKPGATRGIVIVNKQSLLSYLQNLASSCELAHADEGALVSA
jgi:hypothetical protein